MSGRMFIALNDRFSRVFPERRIYIRSDARTRLVSLNPVTQAGLAFVLTAAVGWSIFASVAFLDRAVDGRTAENRLETMREAYEIRLAAMREQQLALETQFGEAVARGDEVTGELSEKQQLLIRAANDLNNAQRELHGLRGEFEAMLADRRAARARTASLEEEIVALRLSLADARNSRQDIVASLDTFTGTMSRVIAERDAAAARAEELDTQVAELHGDIKHWETRQEFLLAQVEEAAKVSFSSLEKVFADSDLDLENILKGTERDFSGKGGPFEPVDDDNAARDTEEDDQRIAALMTDLERVNLMRLAVDKLPFGEPTRGARQTSGFGTRRDPLRRRYASHKGLDFAAPMGTPIYTAADGVVTFSGRQRGYGIVVKIRHAFGFETVYAHLSRSRVSVGDRVERGDRIADMGSTGRSTGSHLHYEIRINEKPVNPIKFIRAARNVL